MTETLTPKERLRRVLRHEPVDRLPTQVNYTGDMGQRLAVHLGVSRDALPDRLGNHLVRVDVSVPERLNADGTVRYDWWGAGHSTAEEGYLIADSPLSDRKDLDAYPWPDAQADGLLDDAQAVISRYGATHFIAPNLGWALFERAWSLRSLPVFMIDMAEDPAFTEALLDRITAIQEVLIERFIALGVDGGYFGDDYGAQKNLMFSPPMWRRFIKPRLARLFAHFRDRGLPILMHSDGQIQPIIPDLIEIGLTALNPVQPEALDHRWLYENFGGRLAFYGGISTQTVLPRGSADEVRAAVHACARDLAPNGTGLLIAPSHRMMTDIPLSNVEAMLDAFASLGYEER
jgi:uroporphyrinogen decarboxylase